PVAQVLDVSGSRRDPRSTSVAGTAIACLERMLPRARRSKELEARAVHPYLVPSIEAPDVPTHVRPPCPDLLRELRAHASQSLGSGMRHILTEGELSAPECDDADEGRSSLANVELLSEPEIRVLAAAFPPSVPEKTKARKSRTLPLIPPAPAPSAGAQMRN